MSFTLKHLLAVLYHYNEVRFYRVIVCHSGAVCWLHTNGDIQDGNSLLKRAIESEANSEESKTVQQHLHVLQQKCDQLEAENCHLKGEADEQKAKNEELGMNTNGAKC